MLQQIIGKFAGYPSLQERLNLLILQAPFLAVGALLVVSSFFSARVRSAMRSPQVAILALVVNAGTKLAFGYTYDTGLGLFCLASDALVAASCLAWLGGRLGPSRGFFARATLGFAIAMLMGLALVFAGAGKWLGGPTVYPYLVLTGAFCAVLWKKKIAFEKPVNWLFLVVAALPLLPYIFASAPPDADTTTQTEILGFFFQGQDFWRTHTGVGHELFHIRYALGYSALSWVIAQALGVWGSESQLILWILTYLLLIAAVMRFCRYFSVPDWVACLFCLTINFTGFQGVAGGENSKMLAYIFVLEGMRSIFLGRRHEAAIFTAAAMMTNPLNGLALAIVYAVDEVRWFWRAPFRNVLILLVGAFWIFNSVGQVDYPTTVAVSLRELTPALFLRHAWKFFWQDSGRFPWVYGFLVALAWRGDLRQVFAARRILLAFLVNVALDGALGADRYPVRLTGGFSNAGFWILSMGLGQQYISAWFPTKLRPIAIGTVALWAVTCFPWFKPAPESVFSTHQCIRLARKLGAILPENALIANIRPPADKNTPNGYGFMFRGDSGRSTVFFRILDHHVKTGEFVPEHGEIEHCKTATSGIEACMRRQGVTHIVIDARPTTEEYLRSFPRKPDWREGQCVAFDLARAGEASQSAF